MQYRRVYVEGGCYFFTLALADRKSDLLVREIDCLRAAFKTVKQNHPFEINAMVVMPDHLHCLWTLPNNDCDYSMRWSLIKANFSRRIAKDELIKNSRIKRGERGIWQRRFWEHTIRDERDFYNHIEYIHHNPVKHGYVSNAQDWPYSSIHLFASVAGEERTATFVLIDGTTFNSNENSTNGTRILVLVIADTWSCCGSFLTGNLQKRYKHSFFAYPNKGHYTQYNIIASGSSQMKKITRQEARDKIVGSILGTLRIEQLQPSAEVVEGMKACVAGQDTTQHLLEQAKNRHAKIRENKFHS